jgi:hypothetical protein
MSPSIYADITPDDLPDYDEAVRLLEEYVDYGDDPQSNIPREDIILMSAFTSCMAPVIEFAEIGSGMVGFGVDNPREELAKAVCMVVRASYNLGRGNPHPTPPWQDPTS